jgi:putative SOS response-associated peptidase YedK
MGTVCGRYVSVQSRTDLQILFDSSETAGDELPPSWNVAPTDPVYAVVERRAKDSGEVARQLRVAKWGLVPSWAKDPGIGSRLINARVETLADKPAWRKAYAARRAVVPAAGYYEWQPVEVGGKTRKQPYYIHPGDGGVLPFAGLYELWRDPTKDADDPDRWLFTVTIVTTEARGPLGEIHDRTPLILPTDRIDAWLDPTLTDPDRVGALLAGISVGNLEARPVPPLVNKVANNGPELVEPLPDAVDEPLQLAITV